MLTRKTIAAIAGAIAVITATAAAVATGDPETTTNTIEPVAPAPARSTQSPHPTMQHGTWGQPVTTAHYTITVSEPKVSREANTCSYGPCVRIADFDVTVTATAEPIQLSEVVRFSGQDDNYAEVGTTWNFQVGKAVLPAGGTFRKNGVQIHYSEESRTSDVVLWADDLDGRHLVEWRLGAPTVAA